MPEVTSIVKKWLRSMSRGISPRLGGAARKDVMVQVSLEGNVVHRSHEGNDDAILTTFRKDRIVDAF